jgi:hypothetical protein
MLYARELRSGTVQSLLEHSSGINGVLVTLEYFQPVPTGYDTNFTLWQQGVRRYGAPISWSR